MRDAALELPIENWKALGRPRRDSRWDRLVNVLLSFEALIVVCVLGLIAIMIPRSIADPDIWWHLRNAHDMLAQHAFVRRDVFSFTARGSPWIDHEWLAELPFYIAWRAAGPAGVYLVTVGMIESTFAGVLLLCWRSSRSWWTASTATVVAALLSTVSFGPRTLLFGWLCLVVELIVLQRFVQRATIILTLPPLFLCWINLHGSWIIGVVVLAIHTLAFARIPGQWLETPTMGRRHLRFLGLSWLGILPLLFCNPWGWRLVAYPFNLAFHQTLNIANVQEWQSLDLHSGRGRVLAAVLMLLVGRQICRPRKWTLVELGMLAIGLWSAFNYSRFLFLLALLAAPLAARSFPGRSTARRQRTVPLVNAALMMALFGLLGFALRTKAQAEDTEMKHFPLRAMSALAHLDVHRRLFNEFLWGGYLEWYDPTRPVFIDSRVDIFEYNGTFRNYLNIVHIKDTLALLDQYHIDAVLFEKDTPLTYLLRQTGSWKTDYDDGSLILLERTPSMIHGNQDEDDVCSADDNNRQPRAVASRRR